MWPGERFQLLGDGPTGLELGRAIQSLQEEVFIEDRSNDSRLDLIKPRVHPFQELRAPGRQT